MKTGYLGSCIACLVLAMPAMAAEPATVTIDGHVDPVEWAGARHVTDFRQVMPFSGAPGSLPTEAWILATPQGLAVAFRNVQPASVPRTRQRVRRDFEEQVDRVNLDIDFDGDARTGYHFSVSSTNGIGVGLYTNESNFSSDWDGNWRHAVGEDGDAWTVEILVPWHVATMRKAGGNMRTLKVHLDRVIGATGERSAWPVASDEQPKFLSLFAPVEVRAYRQSLLAITPYVSGLYDNVRSDRDFEGGLDLFWKPSGQFQLSATVNPDFGQVESDDLVVNFSATETFVGEKRPFFTENQGIFEYTTPSDYSQLLYTRRIGAPADDGSGGGDIDAAIKLNGSLGATKYGIFHADEGGDVGRSFDALRVVRDFGNQNLGAMWVRSDRPWLDRSADVFGIDHNWRPNARWNVRTRLFGSRIDQSGNTARDAGATLWADYQMDHGWRQQWIAMHFGEDLQLNDAGYLSRANLNYLHWEFRKRFDDLPAQSRYASKEWRWRGSYIGNDHGQRLNDQFRVSRQSQLRDGSSEYVQANFNSAGWTDNLTRGNGALRLPGNFNAAYQFERPRKGRWAHEVELGLSSGGLSGNDKVGGSLMYEPTFFVNDAFSINLGAYAERTPDWLVWQHDNLIGSFAGRESHLSAGIDWSIGERQELRLRLQAVAVDARLRQAYRVAPTGQALASDEGVDDFSVRNLGFQIRYRYELAPLSYLYVVYGRGGYRREAYAGGIDDLLGDSFSLRDDEQLLVKLSYRFEL
ncbi:MAG: DUF5916 domain-containing protein [Pseudoxanthomonas sp.]